MCRHFFVSQTVLLNFLKREFENDNYDNSLVTVKGASAVQMQSLADVFRNRCQACNFIKKRLQHRFFLMKLTIFFKNTFFNRTYLLCWIILTGNSVNQWKHTLKVYAAENEMIYFSLKNRSDVTAINFLRIFHPQLFYFSHHVY